MRQEPQFVRDTLVKQIIVIFLKVFAKTLKEKKGCKNETQYEQSLTFTSHDELVVSEEQDIQV